MQAQERIKICKQTRIKAAQAMADVLKMDKPISEVDFCNQLNEKLSSNPEIWDQGWYSPPPKGLSALFAPEVDPKRVAYDNLRKEEFWPRKENIFTDNSIGYIYASPINKLSGIIGDFGMTIYKGSNAKIIEHIKSCLDLTEKTAEYAQVGMEFREIYDYCQKLMKEKGLNNERMITYTDKVGTNIGHTVPWSYKDPNLEEKQTLEGNSFEKVRELISTQRVHLNSKERFKIPPTIAFTIEPRAENSFLPGLPMSSFHTILTFSEGKKEILGNFNPIFQAVKMDFIKSKF